MECGAKSAMFLNNARNATTTFDLAPHQFPLPSSHYDGLGVGPTGRDIAAPAIDRELPYLFARGDIPDFGGVVAGGEELLAVGGERQCLDEARMSLDHAGELAVGGSPEPNLGRVVLRC